MRGSFYCRYRFLGKEACKLLISLKWKRKEIKNLPIKATKEPLQYSVVSSPASCSEIHSLNPSIDQKIGCGGKKGRGGERRGRKRSGSGFRAGSTSWQERARWSPHTLPAELVHRVTLECTALNTGTLSNAYQFLKTGLRFKLNNMIFLFLRWGKYLNTSVYT